MIPADIATNHLAFEAQQQAAANATYQSLSALQGNRYGESYYRLTSLQAWSGYLFHGTFPPNVMEFFVEAQNDGLISHLLARQGMWRPSLQSLRSCLENILVCHYYLDHPVELELWKIGKHKSGFSELLAYFDAHPSFRDPVEASITGLTQLKSEYSDLSKAVHGSSTSFRMGDLEVMPNVFVADNSLLGKWSTRHKATIEALNLFMLTFHRHKLVGTAYPALRKAVAASISQPNWRKIRQAYKVTIAK